MKYKLLFLITIVPTVLFSSCAPKVLYTSNVGFVDYSSYQNEGIFLSESNSVNFEYDAIGSVTAVVFSGEAVLSQTQHVDKDEMYGEYTTVKNKMGWKTARPEDALNEAVTQVKSRGGNGLINIKITPTTEMTASKVVRSGFLVSGMVIKRQ